MSTPAVDELQRVATFRHLFDTELTYVWNTLRRFGVRHADLEDVCHEVFLLVYEKLPTYDDSRPARPWLFAFAFRLGSDYRKRASRARESPRDEIEAVSREPSAEALLMELDRRALLDAALQRVELERRAVLVAHDFDEISVSEIAATLCIPVNTAYSRLRLARDELKTALVRLSRQGGSR